MYCIECGQPQALKEARFCAFCGVALHRSEEAKGGQDACHVAAPEPIPVVGDPPSPARTEAEVPPPAPAVPVPVPALIPAPVNLPPLGPTRWAPLPGQVSRLRQRLRWTIAAAVALLAAGVAGGYLWWSQQGLEGQHADGIEVERVEAAASEPAAAVPAASTPRP